MHACTAFCLRNLLNRDFQIRHNMPIGISTFRSEIVKNNNTIYIIEYSVEKSRNWSILNTRKWLNIVFRSKTIRAVILGMTSSVEPARTLSFYAEVEVTNWVIARTPTARRLYFLTPFFLFSWASIVWFSWRNWTHLSYTNCMTSQV